MEKNSITTELRDAVKFGPNVRRLIAHKMSLDAVPKGGGFNDALNFLSDKNNITDSAKRAAKWVELAIKTLRQAAEPNPWKDKDDEAIAEEFLRKIAERQASQLEALQDSYWKDRSQ